MNVHNRQGHILYERIGQEGMPEAADAILLERSRAWSDEEKSRHITDWVSVLKQAMMRPEDARKPDEYMNVLLESMQLAASFVRPDIPAPAKGQDWRQTVENLRPLFA